MGKLPATPDEVSQRVDKIITFRLRGWSQALIVRYCYENFDWGINKRQLRYYCAQADELLAQEARNTNRRAEFELAKQRYELFLRRALKEKNLKLAADMQDRLVALQGLQATDGLAMDWEHEGKEANPDIDTERVKSIAKLSFYASDDALAEIEAVLSKDKQPRLLIMAGNDHEGE